MGAETKIEWAHSTFNPWIGCTKVAPPCDNCYAAVSTPARAFGVVWGAGAPRRRTSPSTWKQPLAWNRQAEAAGVRRRVFCASLADVYDNEVDPAWRSDVFCVVRDTPYLDWLFLTKRIGNATRMLSQVGDIPANLWQGITVGDQKEADRDIPKLHVVKQQFDLSKAFLSVEPMLGPIRLGPEHFYHECKNWAPFGHPPSMDMSTGMRECCRHCDFTGIGDDLAIDWVICGGESGSLARPMHPNWARNLRDDCIASSVPFLFKQWGEWLPLQPTSFVDGPARVHSAAIDGRYYGSDRVFHWPDNQPMLRVGKKAAGRLLDGVQHDAVPA